MTYNTGNAIGSTDPRDLSDNSKNFDRAVNSADETFVDRLGQRRLTIAGMAAAATDGNPAVGAAAQAVGAAATASAAAAQAASSADLAQEAADAAQATVETAASDAAALAVSGVAEAVAGQVARAESAADAAQLAGNVFADTASGLAATPSGGYFSVPSANSAEFLILYRNTSGSAVEIKKYPSATVFTSLTSLTANQGRPYPARSTTRNGITSGADNRGFLLNAVLNVRVMGARPGYYYRIDFFKNGSAVGGSYRDGWTIHEIAAAGYETSDNAANVVLNYTEYAPEIPRAGIQTVKLDSPRDPLLKIYITVDTEKLPALGTSVLMSRTIDGGYSWIIDPSTYTYREATNSQAVNIGEYWEFSGGVLNVAWRSGPIMHRVTFGPNGYNNLPNIIGFSRSAGTDPATASWTDISSSGTDWLPPLIVAAVSGGDGAASIYTGGNHGSSGSAGGAQTAQNLLYRVVADGRALENGTSGYAESISILIVNELMAYNTISTGRYVIRETFHVQIRPGSIEITCDRRALESVSVEADNGPQAVTVGFQGTQLFYGGTNTARVGFDPTAASGNKSVAPNAWALVLQHPTNGQLVTWMDRAFGVGNGSNVASNRALIRIGGASNTKAYHAAIAGTPLDLSPQTSYKWRGGYAVQAPGLQPAGLDSFFIHHRAGRPLMAYAMPDATWTLE